MAPTREHDDTDTIREALDAATFRFERAGIEAPRDNAGQLLAHLLGTDRGGLVVRASEALGSELAQRFEEWVGRREQREPLQHITGVQEFYGLDFHVDRSVLVPRPETEGVVDAVLELDLQGPSRIADLGTGSGCIAVALATRLHQAALLAVDLSVAALSVARLNARLHRIEERIVFLHADLASPPSGWIGTADVVTSNPPYVSECEWDTLEPEVREFDPREALVAGPSGLETYALLAPAARELLRPGGRLVLELGFGQAEDVRELVAGAGLSVSEIRPDLRGIPRVLMALKPDAR